jgi:hypothetical protein
MASPQALSTLLGSILRNTVEDASTLELVQRARKCWWYNIIDHPYSSARIPAFLIMVPLQLVISITGIFTNGLSFVILGREMDPSSIRFLFRTLAVVDTLVLLSFPFLYTFEALYRYMAYWAIEPYIEYFQYFGKYIYAFTWGVNGLAVLIVSIITIERYIAICKPLHAPLLCTMRNARLSVAFSVCLNFALQYPTVFSNTFAMFYGPCFGSYSDSWFAEFWPNGYQSLIVEIGMYYTLLYVVPLVLLILLNTLLISALKQSSKLASQRKKDKDTRELTVRVILLVIMFMVFQLPAFFGDMLQNILVYMPETLAFLKVDETLLNGMMVPAYCFTSSNSFVNFYIYIITGKRFRQTLQGMCRPKCV